MCIDERTANFLLEVAALESPYLTAPESNAKKENVAWNRAPRARVWIENMFNCGIRSITNCRGRGFGQSASDNGNLRATHVTSPVFKFGRAVVGACNGKEPLVKGPQANASARGARTETQNKDDADKRSSTRGDVP